MSNQWEINCLLDQRAEIDKKIKELKKKDRRSKKSPAIAKRLQKIVEKHPHMKRGNLYSWDDPRTQYWTIHVLDFDTIIDDLLLLQKLGLAITVSESWTWETNTGKQPSIYHTMWNIVIKNEPRKERWTRQDILNELNLVDSNHPLANESILYKVYNNGIPGSFSDDRCGRSRILAYDDKRYTKKIEELFAGTPDTYTIKTRKSATKTITTITFSDTP